MKILTASFILPIAGKPMEDGAVVMDGGKIVEVGKKEKVLPKYPSAEIEDFSRAVLMPGLVNAHTHLDLVNFDSSIAPDFYEFLVASWNFRKHLNPNDRRHSLEEGIRRLLRSGTTCVGDAGHYAGILPTAGRSPIRMVLFPELLSGGEAAISDHYESAFAQVDEILTAAAGRVTAGIAPYAAYTLSRHLLRIISQQARLNRIPVKIHVAETFSEMQFFFDSKGEIAEKLFPKMGWGEALPPAHRKTPVQYLDSIGFLEIAPTLIGCNHLADPDLQTIARTGAKVVHAPRASNHLKLGHPPIKKLRSAGVPVGLGTDGTGSLHSLSLWDEMRYIQDHYPKNAAPEPAHLLSMATIEGARALNLDGKIGSLEPGKEADLIAIPVPKKVTLKDLPAWLVAHVTEREIAAVFVEGKRLKIA